MQCLILQDSAAKQFSELLARGLYMGRGDVFNQFAQCL